MNQSRLSQSPAISGRIAISSRAVIAQHPIELTTKLDQLHISAVELHLNQILEDESRWGDAADQLRDHGIWIVSGSLTLESRYIHRNESGSAKSGILNDHTWFANRVLAEHAARLADRACIGLVSAKIGGIPHDPTGPERAKLLDRLNAMAEIFANYGINFVVQTGEARAEDLDSLLDKVHLPNLGVNFDPADFIIEGLGDPIEAMRRLGPRVRQAYVRDAVLSKSAGNIGREVAVGQGSVNWEAFFGLATAVLPPIHFVIAREARLAKDADLATARQLIAYHLAPGGVHLES